MCFHRGMSVADQACQSLIRHVGLRWVSDQVYGSPMRHIGLWWGMSVSNEASWVSDEACRSPMGLRWGKLVSDKACWSLSDEACRSPMGLRLKIYLICRCFESAVYENYSLSMKSPIYEISYLWNVLSMKCPIYEMSFYELSYLWNVLSMKCPIYEMSCLWNVMKCLSLKCHNAIVFNYGVFII